MKTMGWIFILGLAFLSLVWLGYVSEDPLIGYIAHAWIAIILLGVGTVFVFKVIDRLTPMLPFERLADDRPWLLIILIVAIIFSLVILLRMISISLVPIPK